MNDQDKEILLFAMALDPDMVIQLIEMNWSELMIDFDIIFK